MRASKSLLNCLLTGAGVLAASLWPAIAQAEPTFPAVLQEAANMACAPSCTVCHAGTPSATTWAMKAFGSKMFLSGIMKGNPNSVRTAFGAYKADPANAAGVQALESGSDPDNGSKLCELTYGCGARVAKQPPPSDLSAALWVVGAVVTGSLLRRGRRRAS